MADACQSCFFFRSLGGSVGTCNRNAPDASQQKGSGFVWPIVQTTDWCGDFSVVYPGTQVAQTLGGTVFVSDAVPAPKTVTTIPASILGGSFYIQEISIVQAYSTAYANGPLGFIAGFYDLTFSVLIFPIWPYLLTTEQFNKELLHFGGGGGNPVLRLDATHNYGIRIASPLVGGPPAYSLELAVNHSVFNLTS